MPDSLGNRMKKFESVYSPRLMPRSCVVARVDGRAFHSYTRAFNRPFDLNIISCMSQSALEVAKEMHGFKIGYIQSDEATFVINDYDEFTTQGWFDYKLNKIVSISASLMTGNFNRIMAILRPDLKQTAYFDSRAFVLPEDEVANCLLWRQKDWVRNSLQMYCRSFFSHKQLEGQGHDQMHEMLHSIGKNWSTDLDNQLKNGTFIVRDKDGIWLDTTVQPTYKNINSIFQKALTDARDEEVA